MTLQTPEPPPPPPEPTRVPDVPPIEVDSFWLPAARSTIAESIDSTFYIIYYISIAFFVAIVGAMLLFMIQYKRRVPQHKTRTSPVDHSFKVEVVWTVVPTILLIWFFVLGFRDFAKASVAPGDAMEIQVTAEMYNWTFTYPSGVTGNNELVIPVNKPVKLVMSSKDVLHSFWVAEFRVKADVVPGRYTTLWFEPTAIGDTTLQCTEYCGVGHSRMMAKVSVVSEDDYATWIENDGAMKALPPAELGEKVFNQACVACHSLSGTKMVGPPLNGLMGKSETMADGTTVTIDENYLRESITDPGAKVVQGYGPTMPSFKGSLSDKKIDALIAFLKTKK